MGNRPKTGGHPPTSFRRLWAVTIVFCSGAFGFEGTGVALGGFIVAQFGPIAIFGSYPTSTPVGLAKVGAGCYRFILPNESQFI